MSTDVPARTTSIGCRCILLLTLLAISAGVHAEIERVPRPMRIHRLPELGLEIWTEADPEWETLLTTQHGRPVFSAETPALTYPPAGMTWVSVPALKFVANEIEEGARGAIHQAARNYGIRDATALTLKRVRYGEISGYESRFSGLAQGTRVDVLIFFGHEPDRPAVLAHAYTLEGKLDHISEHIRRSWTHLKYLK